tara:strand:- start:59565 stop:63446 length:3882 start_codon:yes stop_codon:yes gene_type:complete
MKKIFFITVLLISVFGFGQEPVIEWQKSLGGSGYDNARSIQQTSDGGFIIVGFSFSDDGDLTVNNGAYDYWIIKTDSIGEILWQKSYGGSGGDYAESAQQTTDGGYIVSGRSGSYDGDITNFNGGEDYWLLKLDPMGNILWEKSFGGSWDDRAFSIQQTSDNGYIVAGQSESIDGDISGNNGNFDFWVVKLDVSGNISWENTLGGSASDSGRSIQQTSDGGYIVGGTANSNNGDVSVNYGGNDYWLVKLDGSGNILWERSYGGSSNDILRSIDQTITGGYILAGYSDSNDGDVTGNNGAFDQWIVKLNSTGDILWQKSLGGTGYDRALSVSQLDDGGFIIAGDTESNDGDVTYNNGGDDYWIVRLDEFGDIVWQKSLGGSALDIAFTIKQCSDQGLIMAGTSDSSDGDITGNNGSGDVWVIKIDEANISGKIYNDLNENCILEVLEPGIVGMDIIINPGSYMAEASNNGVWYLDSLPIGSYTATIDTTNLNWTSTCPVSQSFTVTDPQAFTPGPDFGMVNNNPCSSPDISIHAPFLRRCFTDQVVYVQACNDITATGALNAAYADVELDSLLTPTSTSIPFTALGNDVFRFQLGNINPGQCVDFTINTTVSCNAILNQTLCLDAKLYPVDSCALDSIPTDPLPPNYGNDPNLVMPQPCILPWDKSSLQVEGWCQGDSVQFSITNTGDLGDGDMDCYSPVLLYVNDTLVSIDSVQLQGQETVYYSYPANGETWILAAEQHPLHPGNSHPNAHVELCGSDSTQWIPDMINNQPLDDADPVDDIYCGIVTGSYDPNDKRGFPTGVTSQHHIQPNQQLQYVIRFQNTGTDTAFTVVIRDTLDTDLNIFTVNSGASSHDYTFKTYGPRVLEWTFDNIMLPDSTTDEPGSNGFVTFTVDQVPDLPNGTVINNQADIYFDFNAPIITNETDHLIDDNIEGEAIGDFVVETVSVCSDYTWSATGQTYTQPGIYTEVLTNQAGLDSTVTLNLTINQPNTGSETITSCENFTWNTNGQTYTQSGQYTEVLTNQYGCDSTITLNLTINQSSNSSETISSCENYIWTTNGQTYTQSGQYTEILTNQHGCDSTVTLDLTINQPNTSTETITSCDSYTWNTTGQTYNQSGNYTTVLNNVQGCDSTVTLELTIDTVITSVTQLDDITLEAVVNNAQYQWIDCNQNYQAIAGATDQIFEATENGSYAAIITQNGCTDTTDCIMISNVGLNDEDNQIMNLYPNPTLNTFSIKADKLINASFKIVDAQGKEVLSGKMNGKEQSIDISSLSKGTYSIVFEDSELPVLSVIKE